MIQSIVFVYRSARPLIIGVCIGAALAMGIVVLPARLTLALVGYNPSAAMVAFYLVWVAFAVAVAWAANKMFPHATDSQTV